MIQVQINAGICGLTTTVSVRKIEGYTASFQLETQCPNWKAVNEQLGGLPIDTLSELFKNRGNGQYQSQVLETALQTIPHLSCPVIAGVLKGLETCTGLAIAKDATITFSEA
ncbi:hypothetical protein JWJ90_21950 [Desulfobulbus rhabdoformis]|uniref:DUF6951 family protein n=1 Tax=Desulfobulbus rhabdoformis TaxID=34032 RepID=UPI00196603A5|nr:hypothetical protein [Desulfobulbus rhabdoformis]MBM9616929.1 hypothetical protein [Desulfobulbus rhabdoformis]